MRCVNPLLLCALSATVGISTAREIVEVGPNGSMCPPDVTIYIQQANFGPGNIGYVTISNTAASSTNTQDINANGSLQSTHTNDGSGSGSSSSSSTATTVTITTTRKSRISSTSRTTRSTRSSRTTRTSRSKTTRSTRTSTTPFSTPTPLITYQAVPPPSTTLSPATVAFVTTDAQGHPVTKTIVETPLGLGAGLPSGTVSDISSTAPVILGFAFGGAGLQRRQEASAGTASGYMQGGGSGDGTGNSCAYASRFYLNGGMLMSGSDGAVGKNRSDLYATIAPSLYANEVTTSFTFENGFLVWRTTDLGGATFYQCGGGPLLAGFPYPPYSNCSSVAIGGIASAACPVDLSETADGAGPVGIPINDPSSSATSQAGFMSTSSTTTAGSAIITSTTPESSVTSADGNAGTSTTMLGTSSTTYATSGILASTTTLGNSNGEDPQPTSTVLTSSISTSLDALISTATLPSSTEMTPVTSSITTTLEMGNTIATSVSVQTPSVSSTIDTGMIGTTTATTSDVGATMPATSIATMSTISSMTLPSSLDDGDTPSTTSSSTIIILTTTTSMSWTTASNILSAITTTTTNMMTTTTTTAFDPNVTNPANRMYNGMVAAVAPVPPEASAYCPFYDNVVIASNGNSGQFFYQIYCDADIGGGDAVYPDGYSAAKVTNMDQCIEICTALNNKQDGYCQAVIFLGPGACYPKTNIYQQTNIPAGRGTQYNYYFAGHIAAQLLDQTYPNPTDTKAVGPGTTTAGRTTTTTQIATATVGGGSDSQVTNPGIPNPPAVATAPVAPTPYSKFDGQVIAANYHGSPSYGYQIFLNANIGGSDIDGTPPGYVSSGWPGFDKCLELCAAWNAVRNGYCQAVIYLPQTLTCYPQRDIYEQTNQPSGRGFQYAYWDPDRTAAQLLDQTYPRPTQTKPPSY